MGLFYKNIYLVHPAFINSQSCFYQFTELGHRYNTVYVFSHLVGLEVLTTSLEGFDNGAQTYKKVSSQRYCLYMAMVWWRTILHLEKNKSEPVNHIPVIKGFRAATPACTCHQTHEEPNHHHHPFSVIRYALIDHQFSPISVYESVFSGSDIEVHQ